MEKERMSELGLVFEKLRRLLKPSEILFVRKPKLSKKPMVGFILKA
jgi:hypothetical protein